MISVLIPIYNYCAVPLVKALREQCARLSVPCEIICMDDDSDIRMRHLNEPLKRMSPEVVYIQLPNNLGRAKIRNKLAKTARFPFLVYLDCDSEIIRRDFLEQYAVWSHSRVVVCGGTEYQEHAPVQPEKRLHWTYGQKREVLSVADRNKIPWKRFKSNNFGIPSTLMLQYPFDESLTEYGHEDTLFGIVLEKNGIGMRHIDNPVLHAGLEDNATFLRKTDTALANLVRISHRDPGFSTRLIDHYRRLKQWRLGFLLDGIYAFCLPLMMYQLHSKKPSIRLFDLYKLCKLRQFYRHEDIYR